MTQFADQVRSKVISQFIRAISRVLLKLIKYFNSTAISSFKVPILPVLFISLNLDLNDSEFVILSSGPFVQNYQKLYIFSNNYYCILLNYTLTSQYLDLLHYLSGYYLFH